MHQIGCEMRARPGRGRLKGRTGDSYVFERLPKRRLQQLLRSLRSPAQRPPHLHEWPRQPGEPTVLRRMWSPVLAHLSRKPATADGRWHVDPTSSHQYRYWDGRTWRRHVVGNGAFSTESRIKTTPPSTEARWTMRIAAATMTIVSVILAIAASRTLQSIRKAERPASRKTDPQLSRVNPISQATAREPRASAESRRVVSP